MVYDPKIETRLAHVNILKKENTHYLKECLTTSFAFLLLFSSIVSILKPHRLALIMIRS